MLVSGGGGSGGGGSGVVAAAAKVQAAVWWMMLSLVRLGILCFGRFRSVRDDGVLLNKYLSKQTV